MRRLVSAVADSCTPSCGRRAGWCFGFRAWADMVCVPGPHRQKHSGASPLVSRLASSCGAVGLKQSVGGILGLVAPCPDHASRRAPSPRPHAPSLNLPFPTTHGRSFTPKAQLLHPDSPSSPRCRCGCYYVPFSRRLLRSAATPFGLCPRSFLHTPPLAFACPLFRSRAHFISLSTQNRFWTIVIHLLPGQQLHSSHVHTYIHTRLDRVSSLKHPQQPAPVHLGLATFSSQLSSPPTLFGPSLHHDTLRTLIDRRCQLDCSL